jgi:A/G-specific adenine glycosylase
VESDRPLEPDEALALALHSSDASHGQLREVSRTFKHMLTHQHIHAVFLKFVYNDLHANKMNQENSYYDASEIEKLPKPILIEKYLKGEII